LPWPPLTLAWGQLAVFHAPPLTLVAVPLAVLPWPPLTLAWGQLAVFQAPPLTLAEAERVNKNETFLGRL